MKHLLILSILSIFSIPLTAQITGKVIHSETNEPIIYTNIWIENQSIGTTTDEAGIFKFETLSDTSTLIFSALGFETKSIKVSDLTPEIRLNPISIKLEMVTVTSPNFRKEKRTGKLKKKGVNFWFLASKQPWRVGKIFPYQSKYEKTPFLKEAQLVIETNQKNRQLLIHVLEVGKGTPDTWEILEQNILHTITQNGKKITTIDLEPYQIKMPKSGVMIVLEWLIIENNRYDFESTDRFTGKKKMRALYEPKVGMIPTETDKNTWIYSKGKWRRDNKKESKYIDKKYQNKYIELAMKLTLSD